MKLNGIRCTDYKIDGNTMTAVFTETQLTDITAMNTALITVSTDDGDTVEIHAGYSLKNVLFDNQANTFTASLTRETEDTIATALDVMLKKLVEQDIVNCDIMLAIAELGAAVAVTVKEEV